jgi:ATP-dependent DNA ligase
VGVPFTNAARRFERLAVMPAKAQGRFIDPMLLLRADSLPNDGDRWEYQLKFDGYRSRSRPAVPRDECTDSG